MKIEVRLFATFRNGREPRAEMEVPEGTRLRDVIIKCGIDEEAVSLPLVNGKFSDLDLLLVDNDILSLFPQVGGG